MAAGKLEADNYRDQYGFYSLELEVRSKWYSLSDDEQRVHIAYLKGLHFFITEPESISIAQLRWLIKHSTVDISIIPLHFHQTYSLASGSPESERVA